MQAKCYRFVTVLYFFCYFFNISQNKNPENIHLWAQYEIAFHSQRYRYRRPIPWLIALILKKILKNVLLGTEKHRQWQFDYFGVVFLRRQRNCSNASAATILCNVYSTNETYLAATTCTGDSDWGVCMPSISNGWPGPQPATKNIIAAITNRMMVAFTISPSKDI